MKKSIVDMVESQVIAAISEPDLIDLAIKSKANIAFLLTGDILSIKEYIHRLQQSGMYVFIHMDFIKGISNDQSGIKYIAQEIRPEGIITTKNHLIKVGNEEGLLTIQRIFTIDQSAVDKGIQSIKSCRPDAIEVLPGVIPRVIYEITELTNLPVIAGGLIKEESEIMEALRAGSLATSVSKPYLWNLGI
jgi:glycerol uptake operon antiterminator